MGCGPVAGVVVSGHRQVVQEGDVISITQSPTGEVWDVGLEVGLDGVGGVLVAAFSTSHPPPRAGQTVRLTIEWDTEDQS